MAFAVCPKIKIDYVGGDSAEVQTIPFDLVITGRKYPDVDLGGDASILAQLDVIMYLAWIALARSKQIDDPTQRAKFDSWGPTVADIDVVDDDDEGEAEDGMHPTQPAEVPETS